MRARDPPHGLRGVILHRDGGSQDGRPQGCRRQGHLRLRHPPPVPRVLRAEGPRAPALLLARPGGPHRAAHHRGNAPVQARLHGSGGARRPVRHHHPEMRQDQRHRERGRHRAAPHLLRDARQLLLRRLLQEGGDPVRVGARHEGVRPRRDSHLRLRLQGGRRGLRHLARRRGRPGGAHQAHGRGG